MQYEAVLERVSETRGGDDRGRDQAQAQNIDLSPVDAASTCEGCTDVFLEATQLGRHAAILGGRADEVRRATQQSHQVHLGVGLPNRRHHGRLTTFHARTRLPELEMKSICSATKRRASRKMLMDMLRPLGGADGESV
jgi:hypothetical protein